MAEGSNKHPVARMKAPLTSLSPFTHSYMHASSDKRLTLYITSPFH